MKSSCSLVVKTEKNLVILVTLKNKQFNNQKQMHFNFIAMTNEKIYTRVLARVFVNTSKSTKIEVDSYD